MSVLSCCISVTGVDIHKLLSNQPRRPTTNLDQEHAASSSVPVVNLDPEHMATPPATELAAQCKLPCCDTTSPIPARSGRPGSKFSPGRDRDRDRNENPAGTGISLIPAGTGMKQCYMLNKIFQNKLRYVKLKLTVSSSQGRIQGGGSDGGGRNLDLLDHETVHSCLKSTLHQPVVRPKSKIQHTVRKSYKNFAHP